MPSDLPGAPQRLHPISLLFSIGGAARRLLLPGIFLFLMRGRSNYEIWFMVLFVPAAIAALVRYFTYRYRLNELEMVVREGILTRNERHIPFSRIQNINLVRNPFHRIFGVAEVQVETASGGKPEAVIRVLSMQAVEELREEIFKKKAVESPQEDEAEERVEPPPLVEVPLRELVLLGLVSNRGMAVVAAIFGLMWQFDFWDTDWENFGKNLPELNLPGPLFSFLVALAGLLVFVVVLRLFSIVWSIVRYYGFTLRRDGDDLRADYGLLTRYTSTIPIHRIQLVSIKSAPLQRLAGRCSLLVETAGGGGNDDDEEQLTKQDLWLAPIFPIAEANRLRAAVVAEADFAEATWEPLPEKARTRIGRKMSLFACLAAIIPVHFIGWWSLLLAGVLVAWGWLHAHFWWKCAGWCLGEDAVGYRSGWWTRRESVLRYSKVQSVAQIHNPFDRRHRMRRLVVDSAGAGQSGHRIRIPFLPEADAERLESRLAFEAAHRQFRW